MSVKKEKTKKINLSIIGNEKEIDKLIELYLPSCQGVSTNKENIILEKKYNEIKYKINVYKINQKNPKFYDTLDICHEIIVVFDISNRESFERLLDNWILWLRDDCKYEKRTILLGLPISQNEKSVSNEEVNNFIIRCEMQMDYLDLSEFNDDDDKNNNLDEVLLNKLNVLENEEPTQGFSQKNCLIF